MIEEGAHPVILRPQELEAVYAINQAVAGTVDTDVALNQIIAISRPVFIFDNIVLYEKRESDTLEPTFAKAIGRGRFREADLAWGEIIAQDACQSGKAINQVEKISGGANDRTNNRHFLGLPLKLGNTILGALVFIRFGGPVFTSDQIHLAEFISIHIAQLLEHRLLVEQVAELEAKRRLDSLQDDFVAMISHELLTPLGFIKGYATTLLREDTSWDEQTRREFLTIIDEESDRLRELIDNLMDSSRLQAGTLKMSFQPTRLDTFLKDLTIRARSLHNDLDIKLEIQDSNAKVQTDPTRLAQVFENILNNAIKYAPNSPVLVTLEYYPGAACVSISDNGPGIAPEHLPKLFQRFYRVSETSAATRGTGLGLYICRKIVQAHGGEISVESTVGQGTTFRIHLPYAS